MNLNKSFSVTISSSMAILHDTVVDGSLYSTSVEVPRVLYTNPVFLFCTHPAYN